MSNYTIVTSVNGIDRSKWSEFVYNHPCGNIFQAPEMYEVYESTEKCEPVFLAIINNNDEIAGTLLAINQKQYRGVLGRFTARSIIQGGPLIKKDDPDVLDFILKEFNKVIKRKAIYTQFRNFFDLTEVKTHFGKFGWQFEEHLNIMIDLSKTEEVLWKEVHSKRRNEIRRAEKEGTCFKVLKNKNEFDMTYDILKEVYDRAKLPLPGIQFFRTAYDVLGPDHFKIFLAVNEEKVIGTMYVLCFEAIMYDWYAGSYQAYYKKYPNDLIPWKVFLWGKENGFKTFDFGGAGKPGVPYGVRDYKKKFGGGFVNHGRFEKIHKPLLFQFGKLGLKVWQKLK